ncbi:CopY/TcrY family copper transport repressor [Deltaproteobacteria bacterium Smac51]|nr:CopY/TcrY family copper transport repressor [Deltaproteobacteria bacterium Smac51]
MKEKINITEAEWPIMEVLWLRPTATAAEIVEQVTSSRQVSMRTVKTLIRRLIAKDAVAFEVDAHDSRIYHYRALVLRPEVMEGKNKSFLGQLYGNSVSEMLSHFITNSDLKKEEIEHLQAILKQKEIENG